MPSRTQPPIKSYFSFRWWIIIAAFVTQYALKCTDVSPYAFCIDPSECTFYAKTLRRNWNFVWKAVNSEFACECVNHSALRFTFYVSIWLLTHAKHFTSRIVFFYFSKKFHAAHSVTAKSESTCHVTFVEMLHANTVNSICQLIVYNFL